jgi:hypothetical protein
MGEAGVRKRVRSLSPGGASRTLKGGPATAVANLRRADSDYEPRDSTVRVQSPDVRSRR